MASKRTTLKPDCCRSVNALSALRVRTSGTFSEVGCGLVDELHPAAVSRPSATALIER
jgi:hypothetical protein